MTFYTSTLLNENISNFSQIEDNAEDLSRGIHINSIFKYGTNLSNLDEDKDEYKNLLFIHNENIERYNNNNSRLIFKTERTKKKRGPKKRKESKDSRKHLEKMKNSKFLDILKYIDISNKYKYYNKDINKMSVEALIKFSWFRKIFETKYFELFLHYITRKRNQLQN